MAQRARTLTLQTHIDESDGAPAVVPGPGRSRQAVCECRGARQSGEGVRNISVGLGEAKVK